MLRPRYPLYPLHRWSQNPKFGTDVQKEKYVVRIEVFTAVTTKNAVFWDIKPRSYLTESTLRLRHRVQLVNAM
jgi:hypothetical protein